MAKKKRNKSTAKTAENKSLKRQSNITDAKFVAESFNKDFAVEQGKSTRPVEENPSQSFSINSVDAEREFFEIMNYQRCQENGLIGKFNNKGIYEIPNNFQEELLQMPKKFDHYDDNIMYASTVLGNFVLNFKIEMDIAPDFCKAKLFLIEIEQQVENEDLKHLTLLDELTEIYTPNFRTEFCEKWHIYFDDQVIELGEIHSYLENQEQEHIFNRELVDILSQIYIVRMLSFLDSIGEKGQKSKLLFKELMEKISANDPSFASDFTKQKQLMDSILRKNQMFTEILKTPIGKEILTGFSTPIRHVRDKEYPSAMIETSIQSPVKKTEPKKTNTSTLGNLKNKSAPAKKASAKTISSPKSQSKSSKSSSSPAKTTSPPAILKKDEKLVQSKQPQLTIKPKKQNRQNKQTSANFPAKENYEKENKMENIDTSSLFVPLPLNEEGINLLNKAEEAIENNNDIPLNKKENANGREL